MASDQIFDLEKTVLTKSNQVFAERILKEQNPILVFDEIHKNLKWKPFFTRWLNAL